MILYFYRLYLRKTDFSNFDCGRDDINDFFLNDASDYQEELFGKTYVFVPEDTPANIVAAFTVVFSGLSKVTASGKTRINIRRFVA